MLNFLPQKNRKQIISEYVFRIVSVLLLFIFLSCIILISFFLPSFFYVKYKNETIDNQLLSFQQKNQDKSIDPAVFMKNINKLSDALSNSNLLITYGDLIDKLTSYKNKDIKILSISISPDKTPGDIKVLLNGTAKTRDGLTSFSTDMKTDGFFNSVIFPVSNFLKSSDLEFSSTLIYKNK